MDASSKMEDVEVKIDSALKEAARTAAESVLAVKDGETALIITNPESNVYSISLAMYDAILEFGGKPVIMIQPFKTQLDFAEKSIIGAIKANPDICISLSAEKLGKDEAGIKDNYKLGEKEFDHIFDYLYRGKMMKCFWSPSVTAEMFKKTVPIDYARLRKECADIKAILDKAISVRVTTEKGTDITIGLMNRLAESDDGDFRIPGTGGNLPAGEVWCAPVENGANGKLVIDGSIGDLGQVPKMLTMMVENGRLISVECEDKDFVCEVEKLCDIDDEARIIGELGIGLNPGARIVGIMLEDEKAGETAHIAFGNNMDMDGGMNNSKTHRDFLFYKPTIIATYMDGSKKDILIDGKVIC